MDRLYLAIELIRGHRGLVALSKEEFQELGVWGDKAHQVLSMDPVDLHDWLCGVVNEELAERRDAHAKDPVWYDNQVFYDGAEVEIKADDKTIKYSLEMGALRRKRHSTDPKEDWMFLCGRPKR